MPASEYPGWCGVRTAAPGSPSHRARSVPRLTALTSVSTLTCPTPGSGTSTGSTAARPGAVHTIAAAVDAAGLGWRARRRAAIQRFASARPAAVGLGRGSSDPGRPAGPAPVAASAATASATWRAVAAMVKTGLA